MKFDIKEVQKMIDEIESAKTNKAELEGEQKAMMRQLFEKFDCKTLASARELLEKIQEQIKEFDESVSAEYERIRVKYDWA